MISRSQRGQIGRCPARMLLWLCSILILGGAANGSPRPRISLNENWKFTERPVTDAEKESADDTDWQSVSIPHTWNSKDPFDDEPGYRRGTAWYRRTLSVDIHQKTRRSFLYFE